MERNTLKGVLSIYFNIFYTKIFSFYLTTYVPVFWEYYLLYLKYEIYYWTYLYFIFCSTLFLFLFALYLYDPVNFLGQIRSARLLARFISSLLTFRKRNVVPYSSTILLLGPVKLFARRVAKYRSFFLNVPWPLKTFSSCETHRLCLSRSNWSYLFRVVESQVPKSRTLLKICQDLSRHDWNDN